MKHKQDVLTPARINRENVAYQTVSDIAEKLKNKDSGTLEDRVYNIAVTGPYGSGKSSVLNTLQQDYPEFKYLQISLATLKANEEGKQENTTQTTEGEEGEGQDGGEVKKSQKASIDDLHQKVEYSILQQIIYKEKINTLPNSRFRRILHLNFWKLLGVTVMAVFFFIFYALAFGHKWEIVDLFYNEFGLDSTGRLILGGIGVVYIAVCFALLFRDVYRRINSMQISGLNLKDGSIDLQGDESVFNKHMEEIVYFFQVTKYDVVIIEDLDRFGSTELFLKLRELNYLLNKSKIIDRTIVFIYAIKDDLFENSSRTKFFDYIATVIPVINLSNSKDKLKEELEARGFDGFEDDDLITMSSFISDMRLLKNIANEFQQYYVRLCKEDEKIDKTKLLGMIIYKNIHPQDFADLHIGKGKVYNCLNKKSDFIALVKDKVLKGRKQELQKLLDDKDAQTHIKKKKELRELYMFHYLSEFPSYPIDVHLNGRDYTPKAIAQNEDLFNLFRSQNHITYTYFDANYRTNYRSFYDISSSSIDFDIKQWDKKVDGNMTYEERLQALSNDLAISIAQRELDIEESKFNNITLSTLIKNYQEIRKNQTFTKIGLTQLMEKFLMEGYIDEHYYEYISYFYPNMINNEEAQFVSAVQLGKPTNCLQQLINVKNIIDRIPATDFRFESVLNIYLLDWLVEHKDEQEYQYKLNASIDHIVKPNGNFDFLVKYYQEGKYPTYIFQAFIESEDSWNKCINSKAELQNILIEGWLQYCTSKHITDMQISWMNSNYQFLSNRAECIWKERDLSLIDQCKFETLESDDDWLLDYVIDNSLYKLSAENICLILNYVSGTHHYVPSTLNYTRVLDSKSEHLIKYVEDNMSECVENAFSQTTKDEGYDALLKIINHKDISDEIKKEYLSGQMNKIPDILQIEDEFRNMAMDTSIVFGNWKNVAGYCNARNEIPNESLYHFVDVNADSLSEDNYDLAVNDIIPKSIVYSNKVDIEAYKKVLPKLKEHLNDSDEDALTENLEKERIELLVNSGMLTYNENTASVVSGCEPSVYATYLLQHREFVKNISELDLSGEVISILIEKSLLDKVAIASSVTEEQIEDYPKLADQICHLVLNKELSLDMNILLAIMTGCNDLQTKIGVFNLTIRRHKENQNHDIVKELLSVLPEPYSLLREQPDSIPANIAEDDSVMETLKICRFISRYNNLKAGSCRLYYKNGMKN